MSEIRKDEGVFAYIGSYSSEMAEVEFNGWLIWMGLEFLNQVLPDIHRLMCHLIFPLHSNSRFWDLYE